MIIKTEKLTKTYKIFEKEPGLAASVKSLFVRKYKYKTALQNFDLNVEEGEFIGLIGPNGAGKTTLIKMLTGIISPTSGNLSVMGFTPGKLENDMKRGYALVMGQKSQLFFELTPADTFLLFKKMYGISDENYKNNIAYFTELFGVEKLLNVQVRTLSLGERMKMELITALLHDPKVLFLDEPTIGLDAIAQKQIRTFLRKVNEERKTTIIFTSHYMEDIKSLCGRCVVVNNGEKIYDGETDALFEKYRVNKKITVLFAEDTGFIPPDGCVLTETNSHKFSFLVPKETAQETLVSILGKWVPDDITIEEDEIGSVVERIYSERGIPE